MTSEAPDPEAIRDVVLSAHANFARVKELIERDPELLNVSAPWDETPLQAASHMGNRQIAEWLLDRGAPLDVFAAAMLGRSEDVETFLADDPELVSASGVHGMPILFFPAAGGSVGVAEFLVKHGADINAGAGSNTPLHAAVQMNRPAMTTWLLAHGADRTARDFENKTPLDRARDSDHAELVAMLEAGAG